MKKTNINSKKGFTIIEVVLVLAIAGLIFLMVFVALPNLQRTQRDTQRRDDISRVATALTQYITNNGKTPASSASADFVTNYLTANGEDTFVDPSGSNYVVRITDATPASGKYVDGKVGEIDIYTGTKCGADENTLAKNDGNRHFAVITKLEGAGTYCTDN